VSDTVEGIYAATQKAEANGEIFNIGSTDEISIVDLARMIHRLGGVPGEPELVYVPYESFTGKRYEDVRRRLPDVSLCERLLGVRAWIGLEEGLARTIAWQRDFTSAMEPA
jgi:UDP-glucose 4-epimerase